MLGNGGGGGCQCAGRWKDLWVEGRGLRSLKSPSAGVRMLAAQVMECSGCDAEDRMDWSAMLS